MAMDTKELRTESTLSATSNDGNAGYNQHSPALQTHRNKSYQDIGSNSLGKVDTQTARPCAIIGPDRVIPPPPASDVYLRKASVEPWSFNENVYRSQTDFTPILPEYQQSRNISPRQTFQENMQRILVPPTYSSNKNTEDPNLKSSKDVPLEIKYSEVPYIVNHPINGQRSIRNPDVSMSSVNPSFPKSVPPHGWNNSVSSRPIRPYGAPEFYQYPEFVNYNNPRMIARPLRTAHDDPAQAHADRLYHQSNIRFKPYPAVKERLPQTRYDYVSNYPNAFHHHAPFPPQKFDISKTVPPHPYPMYSQVPMRRITEPILDSYQRSSQPPNFNPYHNQYIPPHYGPVPGNNLQAKMYSHPPEVPTKPIMSNKLPYDSNSKVYFEYENNINKMYPPVDNMYYPEMNRQQLPKGEVAFPLHPGINMQYNMPPQYLYRKDNIPVEHIQFRSMDQNLRGNSPLVRNSLQFPSSGVVISPVNSNTSNDTNTTIGNMTEDCGYVSQSSSASVRSTESGNHRLQHDIYQRHINFYNSNIKKYSKSSSIDSSDKKSLNVRQFLQMWNEGEEEIAESNNTTSNNMPTNSETISNQEQLYVLGLVNIPSEELSKYEHIQKISKLPDNIKGYNSIELLDQYEQLVETPSLRQNKNTSSQDYQASSKVINKPPSQIPRPVSPLDVEAKISQSVIHKEVGCNFEIKPCSPKMLNADAATPVQNILDERAIEKVINLGLVSSSIHTDKVENKTSCKMNSPYISNNDSMKSSNYSFPDLESNSGLCLASLPRLDSDIELNFPEINQQFIDANKINPNIENVLTNNVLHKNETSDLNVEKEPSKLSKYRKNKVYDCTTDGTGHRVVNRTDSVIIKNPDNVRNQDNASNIILEDNDNKEDVNKKQNNTESETISKMFAHSISSIEENSSAIDFSLNKIEKDDYKVDSNNLPELNNYEPHFSHKLEDYMKDEHIQYENKSSDVFENNDSKSFENNSDLHSTLSSCEETSLKCLSEEQSDDNFLSSPQHTNHVNDYQVQVSQIENNANQSNSYEGSECYNNAEIYQCQENIEEVGNMKLELPSLCVDEMDNKTLDDKLLKLHSKKNDSDINKDPLCGKRNEDETICQNTQTINLMQTSNNTDETYITKQDDSDTNNSPKTLISSIKLGSEEICNIQSIDDLRNVNNFEESNLENCKSPSLNQLDIKTVSNIEHNDSDNEDSNKREETNLDLNKADNMNDEEPNEEDFLNKSNSDQKQLQIQLSVDVSNKNDNNIKDILSDDDVLRKQDLTSDYSLSGECGNTIPTEDLFNNDDEQKNCLSYSMDLPEISSCEIPFCDYSATTTENKSEKSKILKLNEEAKDGIEEMNNCTHDNSKKMSKNVDQCNYEIEGVTKNLPLHITNDDNLLGMSDNDNESIKVLKLCNTNGSYIFFKHKYFSSRLQNLYLFSDGKCVSSAENYQCTTTEDKFSKTNAAGHKVSENDIIMNIGVQTLDEHISDETLNKKAETSEMLLVTINQFEVAEADSAIEHSLDDIMKYEDKTSDNEIIVRDSILVASVDAGLNKILDNDEAYENLESSHAEESLQQTTFVAEADSGINQTCDSNDSEEYKHIDTKYTNDSLAITTDGEKEVEISEKCEGICQRKTLKRSLSDSALELYNNDKDKDIHDLVMEFTNKRRKTIQKKMYEEQENQDVCGIIQSSRRNSISICNSQSVFILIDNDYVISQDDDTNKICYTELPTEFSNASDAFLNVCVPKELEDESSVSGNIIENLNVDNENNEPWIEDIGCAETIFNDDVAEDITIGAPISPISANATDQDASENSDSDHVKLEEVYDDTVFNEDSHFTDIYNTAQANLDISLDDLESQNVRNTVKSELINNCIQEEEEKYYLNNEINIEEKENEMEELERNISKHIQARCNYSEYQKHGDFYEDACDFSSKESNSKEYIDSDLRASLSSSPEVSSTTSEEKSSSILLKITSVNGSRKSHISNSTDATQRVHQKLTEITDYSTIYRPLITKAAKKYIPPLKDSHDLKVKLPLPKQSLDKLKRLKLTKDKVSFEKTKQNNLIHSKRHEIPKKIKPKFEDVLRSIDEIQFKMQKDKSKKLKNSIPKVVIKKNENGAHYASTPRKTSNYNPDLTGRKWQPWVFIERNELVDKMALKNKMRAIYCHRKKTFVLAEKFKKYKSICTAKFVISQPNNDSASSGNLKYTIKLKHNY